MAQKGCCWSHNCNHLPIEDLAGTKVLEAGKPIMMLTSLVFCDLCQATGPLSLVLLASFYKT